MIRAGKFGGLTLKFDDLVLQDECATTGRVCDGLQHNPAVLFKNMRVTKKGDLHDHEPFLQHRGSINDFLLSATIIIRYRLQILQWRNVVGDLVGEFF